MFLSAFVPTLITQQLFHPAIVDVEEEEALGEEDLSIIHYRSTASQQPQASLGGERARVPIGVGIALASGVI